MAERPAQPVRSSRRLGSFVNRPLVVSERSPLDSCLTVTVSARRASTANRRSAAV
jgi:hypothetical protein